MPLDDVPLQVIELIEHRGDSPPVLVDCDDDALGRAGVRVHFATPGHHVKIARRTAA